MRKGLTTTSGGDFKLEFIPCCRALCIAKREAKLRADLNNWCCYGVFALYYEYVPKDLKALYGVDEPADLYDARTNIAIAYQIYLRGGWDPWSQTDPGSG